MSEDESLSDDLQPILWKWLIRLIWVSSIISVQIVEFNRYLSGQSYRPFFSLYAGILLALVLRFVVSLLAAGKRRIRPATRD
jgi:hypothetical protein